MSTAPAGWAALLPDAMVGTERQARPLQALPGAPGALAAQAAASAGGDAATALLRSAAVLAACSLAGRHGTASAAPLPPAAAPETRTAPAGAGPVHAALRGALLEGPLRLSALGFAALARTRQRLPPALLPAALELGRRSLALRPLLLPVLGARGAWLAAQREDWRWAAGGGGGGSADGEDAAAPADEAAWTDGSPEQRLAFLTRERRRDPAAARERLQRALPELPARERAGLVGALAPSLAAADEPLLELLRADRSREVRQAALSLLLRLPQAAHPLRAADRVAALLVQRRVLLRRRWQIDAPAQAADDWAADQVEAARAPGEALGERAWWLYQLVRQVPLGWWTRTTGMTAAELLEWSNGTDWTAALRRGWLDVLLAAPDDDWGDAWLAAHPAPSFAGDPAAAAQVLALLPAARRERHLQRWLREGGAVRHSTLASVVTACPLGQTFSAETSALLAGHALARAARLHEDPALRSQLAELACTLHPDALGRLAALPRPEAPTPACAETLDTLQRVIEARRVLLTP